uniref:Reverse transcriptase domain-containing protein n=1 Tax=Caenorhabditis japonica TaxID=281687 RepID=A0A8R1IHB3_CAEJA
MAQCGVPQGAVLSPILFGIYVNEIPSKLPMGVHCKQFADDIKLYSEIPKDSDPQNNKLQQAIDAICQWKLGNHFFGCYTLGHALRTEQWICKKEKEDESVMV